MPQGQPNPLLPLFPLPHHLVSPLGHGFREQREEPHALHELFDGDTVVDGVCVLLATGAEAEGGDAGHALGAHAVAAQGPAGHGGITVQDVSSRLKAARVQGWSSDSSHRG